MGSKLADKALVLHFFPGYSLDCPDRLSLQQEKAHCWHDIKEKPHLNMGQFLLTKKHSGKLTHEQDQLRPYLYQSFSLSCRPY